MGIKYFFSWLRVTYPSTISLTHEGSVENLYIDLNGLLHPLAQKFYEYGDYRHVRLLSGDVSVQPHPKTIDEFADAVLEKILSIVHETNTTRRIMIAIDGVAPVAKQCQQRKRRCQPLETPRKPRSTTGGGSDPSFDPVCISIGTEFMTELCTLLADRLRTSPKIFQEVVFSDIYAPGEGEHKIIQMIRRADPMHHETHCIHTLDADIIMLAYLTRKNVLVYREFGNDISWINIPLLRRQIGIPPEDFVLMSMILGNDFLPPLPGLDIRKGIVDTMIRGYRIMNPNARPGIHTATNIFVAKRTSTISSVQSRSATGYAPATDPNTVDRILPKIFARYLDWIGLHCYENQDVWEELVNPTDRPKDVAQNYLETMVWNFEYYAWGLRDWETSYAYNYALPARTLAHFFQDLTPTPIRPTEIPDPILQLVCIVPYHHANLVPRGMRKIFSDPEMQGYYTTDLKIVRRRRTPPPTFAAAVSGTTTTTTSSSPPPSFSSSDDYTIFMKYVNFPKVKTIYRRYAQNLSIEDGRFNGRSQEIVLRKRHAAAAAIPP